MSPTATLAGMDANDGESEKLPIDARLAESRAVRVERAKLNSRFRLFELSSRR